VALLLNFRDLVIDTEDDIVLAKLHGLSLAIFPESIVFFAEADDMVFIEIEGRYFIIEGKVNAGEALLLHDGEADGVGPLQESLMEGLGPFPPEHDAAEFDVEQGGVELPEGDDVIGVLDNEEVAGGVAIGPEQELPAA